jgi:hypothetical protein
MDIFLYQPERLGLATETSTQRVSCGYRDGREGPLDNTQTALVASLPGAGAIPALLYPRLKTEPVPEVTWSAEGRIAQVKSAAGMDYVFLAAGAEPKAEEGVSGLKPLMRGSPIYGCMAYSRGGEHPPWLLLNKTGKEATDTRFFKLAPDALAVHPSFPNPVTVVWQSPVAGTVSVEALVADADPGKDDSGSVKVDGVTAEIRKGKRTLAKATIANGGPEARLIAENVSIAVGERLRLVVEPGANEWFDSTRIELKVRDAAGKTWDLRKALLEGEKLGNQTGSDPAKAVWWVCSGDAPEFDPRDLVPPPMEEFTSADGKVRFQGTAGAVQVRGAKVTVTLGAAGRIQAGRLELAADGPATKMEAK